ncbi:hypothetical protein Q5P01_026394 [Channa striata]|uniref:Uncharacterized protein n=1 Tax=Channa striata TaxID=64152 RepID=A0AA88LKG2_CHASR|nr:hypothetical protein Q5P01_026394 [Channa striata]
MFTAVNMFVCAVFVFSALTIVEMRSLSITEDKHVIIKAEFGKTEHKDRIHVKNTGYVLSVTFTDLRKSDSKTYYCGVEKYGQDRYVKVNLQVIDAVAPGPSKTATTASVVSTVSSAVTHSSMSSSSSDTVTHLSHTIFHTTSTAARTTGLGSLPYLFIGLTIIITILVVLLKLMRDMNRRKLLTLRTDSPQAEETEYHDIRFEDDRTESSPVDVSAVYVFTDVPSDSVYANYSYQQDRACAESRVTDPQPDLVYSLAQLPEEQIKLTEQPKTNVSESSKDTTLYSLIPLQQET